jgi:hypothetical protein
MEIPGWIMAKEAYAIIAAASKISERTFWSWVKRGELDSVETRYFGTQKRYNEASLRAWVAKKFDPTPTGGVGDADARQQNSRSDAYATGAVRARPSG